MSLECPAARAAKLSLRTAIGALAFGLSASAAWAQVPQVPVQVSPPLYLGPMTNLSGQQRGVLSRQGTADERGLSVFERARERYEPYGIRVGSFGLFPSVELGVEYNSNIYAAPSGEDGDGAVIFRPTLGIRSDLPQHQVNFDFSARGRRYFDHRSEDTLDYAAGVNGRFDLSEVLFLFGRANYLHGSEDRGVPTFGSGLEPTRFEDISGVVGISQQGLRLNYQFDVTARQRNYDSTPTVLGDINNDSRNYNTLIGSGRVGWEFTSALAAFVRGSVNTRDYPDLLPGAVDHASDGYEVVAGLRGSNPTVFDYEIYGGVLSQKYDRSGFGRATYPTFGLSGTYNFTPLMTGLFNVSRSLEETGITTAAGNLQTTVSGALQYEVLENLLAEASLAYSLNQYIRDPREDDIWVGAGTLRYLINNSVSLNGQLSYTKRDSNASGSDFDRFRGVVSMTLAW